VNAAQRDNENLRDALRNLTNGFNIVAKDRTPFTDPSSKKLALFGVTNVLFKIYFKLNTLQLCSKLINVVERPGALNALDHYLLFPVSDVVTYKFYIGRLKMFEDKYEDARSPYFPSLCVDIVQRLLPLCSSTHPSQSNEKPEKDFSITSSGADESRGHALRAHREEIWFSRLLDPWSGSYLW
jgi:hypothetical protein